MDLGNSASMHPGKPEDESSSEIQDEDSEMRELLDAVLQDIISASIHRVPHSLRQVNKKAYEPKVISIGPYHHGKPHLKEMQDMKKRFFEKTAGKNRERIHAAIVEEEEKEERISKCYAEANSKKLSPEAFVEMVVLDGFFIVRLFTGNYPVDLLLREYIRFEIRYDLLLLENQLPFFVLEKLYGIMIQNDKKTAEFADLAMGYFGYPVGDAKSPKDDIKHLLALIHDSPRWIPSIGTKQKDEETKLDDSKKANCGWKFISCARKLEKTLTGKEDIATDPEMALTSPKRREEEEECVNGNENKSKKSKCGWKFILRRRKLKETKKKAGMGDFIRCARELEEAGISFESRDEEEEKCRALDIEFKFGNCRKAKLRIPKLQVEDSTELVLRNLIAFEQFFAFDEPTYVLDYVKFVDQLINSEQDVQLLCNADIIENWLGDYRVVARVFNRLLDNTYQSPDNFYYSDIFEQVNKHCSNRVNKQMAILHRNYFNSPWALLSFLAALLLIFLTFAQTTFTLLTIPCLSCVVLFIVFGVLLAVIGLVFCLCFA